MPNNFRILPVGAYFISKEGSDGSVTPQDSNTPKATLTSYGAINVVGAGVYKGALSLNGSSINQVFRFDGKVVLDLTGNMLIGRVGGGVVSNEIFNNISDNYVTIQGKNLYYIAISYNGNAPVNITWYKTIFQGVLGINDGLYPTQILNNCIISGGFSRNYNGAPTYMSYTMCFNMSWSAGTMTQFTDGYADSATIITWPTFVADFNAGRFYNNNFQGIINIGGTLYELKQDKDGNPIDPNPAVLDLGTLVTGLYTTRKNFSQDPEFLNIEKRDYWSVANTSPMLFADSTGIGSIGNVYYSKTVKATDTEFSTGTITDLVTNANDFILDSPATSGSVVSLPIQIAPIPQAIGRINFAELLNFNSSETLGTTENNNVTIVDNFADGTAGANPRRLTYEMRWSNQSTIPTLDAHWDNQGYITAGDYAKFEQFTKPLIDVSGIGNGDPLFNTTGAVGLKAKWIQVRITMLGGIG